MTTPTARDRAPGLVDVVRIVKRWGSVVLLCALAGAVFGVTLLPSLTAPDRSNKASVRVDVKPLPAAVESRPTANTVVRGQKAPDPSERYQDPLVMAQVLAQLGGKANDLTVLHGVIDKNQVRVATRSITAVPLPGTTQVRFSFVDEGGGLARDVVLAYAELYARNRNANYVIAMDGLIKTAGETAKRDYDNLLRLSRQADAERAASGAGMTTTTQVLLDLAVKKYDASGARLTDLTRTRASGVVPTQRVGEVVLTRLDTAPSRLVLLVIGLLLGTAIGVGAALSLEAVRDRLSDVDDLIALTGSPVVLASVPASGRARKGITVVERPDGAAATALNRARLALEMHGVGRGTVVAVTSAGSGDGRSTVTLNVAASRAGDDHDVVVVCADLRHRQVEEFFGIAAEPGLTDLLLSPGASADGFLIQVAPHLLVLPGGVAGRGAAELRRTERLTEVLDELRGFGTVIVDAPSGLAAEVLSVVAASDSTVVVARSGHTSRQALRDLCGQLQQWGNGSVGSVLLARSGLVAAHWPFRGGLGEQVRPPSHAAVDEPVISGAQAASALTPPVRA